MSLARRVSIALAIACLFPASAFADEAADAARFDGQWTSGTTRSTYTIKAQGDEASLVSLVDDDGEEYIVKFSSWNGRTLRWKYFVPSTGYTVEEKVHLEGDDALAGEWISIDPDGGKRTGNETWTRAAPPAATQVEKLAGRWLNASTKATYTIEVDDGHAVLVSVVDDDTEVYEVERSDFNGRLMRWKYFVPSTKYTVEEKVHLQDENTLAGAWTSTDPDGGVRTGEDTWSRIIQPVAGVVAPPGTTAQTDAGAYGGRWLNKSTSAVYTVSVQDGHVELESVVDDDGEAFDVLRSSWNGDSLRWKYKVPSTGYIVEESVRLDGPDALSGTYKSTSPDGTVNEDSDSWSRVK